MTPNDWHRFMSFVDITDTCWIWTGVRNKYRYGVFHLNSKQRLAHRVILAEKLGRPVIPGLCAAHTPLICHNRSCVNPEHLRECTLSNNQLDRHIDGTMTTSLTEEDIHKIRADPRSQRDIAAEYGISQKAVSLIINRKIWSHLTSPSPLLHPPQPSQPLLHL